MVERNRCAVLVAEADPKDARQVVTCLLELGMEVYLAMSKEDVFRWLHRRVFRRAVVAAELTIGGEMLVARLARLSAITRLIAVGPAGDLEVEARCRSAGAKAYIGRPVNVEMLGALLGVPAKRIRNRKTNATNDS